VQNKYNQFEKEQRNRETEMEIIRKYSNINKMGKKNMKRQRRGKKMN
jgi:hypothetical protein